VRLALAGLLLLSTTPTVPARAERAAIADAEALFREGKRLLEQHDFAHACPKLAESVRLDPATGALLALALCHEGEGRNATAWAEYGEVAARAAAEGRHDREEAAREKRKLLEPKLATMTITVSVEDRALAGFGVRRDGMEIGSPSWGLAIPVDPGIHLVEATAPDHHAWRRSMTVGAEERQQISIPRLAEMPPAPTTAPVESIVSTPRQSTPGPRIHHRGFFLHMALGPEVAKINIPPTLLLDGSSITALNAGFNVGLGGPIARRLILFAGLFGARTLSCDYNGCVTFWGLGPGLAYYFETLNIFVAVLGAGTTTVVTPNGVAWAVTNYTAEGFGAQGQIGKEWWASDNWGLGLVGQYTRTWLWGSSVEGNQRWTGSVFSLLLSATFS
jgi:hypothetical protein